VTAVWIQYDGVRYSIWANRYAVGSGWSVAQLIETDDSGSAYDPQVAADDQGNAIVVWSQSDDTRHDIWTNRYVVGSGWDGAQLVEVYDSGDARYPQVAADDQGNAVAVWHQFDGARYNIYSNQYVAPDITAPPLSLSSPIDGMTTDAPLVTVSGTTEPSVILSVNGILAAVEDNGSFSCKIALEEGSNTIVVTATDAADNSVTISRDVVYDNPFLDLIDGLRDQLNATDQALGNATNDIEDLRGELNTTKELLSNAINEVEDLRDELNTIREDLNNLSDGPDSVESENLMFIAVFVIVAALVIVMSVMYFSLSRKMSRIDGKSTQDDSPPPPQA
jgi:uncharacterized protein YbdZ (MbtH family)